MNLQASIEIRRRQGGGGEVDRIVNPRCLDDPAVNPFVLMIPDGTAGRELLSTTVAGLFNAARDHEMNQVSGERGRLKFKSSLPSFEPFDQADVLKGRSSAGRVIWHGGNC